MEKNILEMFNEDERILPNFRRMFSDGNFENGPLNPMIKDETFEGYCPYSPDGICAMMTCLCFEEGEDWYTGVCKNCGEEIESKNKAFRIPNENGGFVDCFCSKDCARDQFRFLPDTVEHILIEIAAMIIELFPIIDVIFLRGEERERGWGGEKEEIDIVTNSELGRDVDSDDGNYLNFENF